MDKITHDWKCTACGHWNPDVQTQTRCASCRAPRPDIAEYRKRPARSSKAGDGTGYSYKTTMPGPFAEFLANMAAAVRPAKPGDIVWACEQCGHEHTTSATFCPECGRTRPVNGTLRVKAPARWPRTGALIGIIGCSLLWWQAGGWAALGAFLIVWGDNLGRGR